MTNDAPERIWTCPDDAEWITGHWDLASDGLPMEAEYIRADHAQAELQAAVAAAYEDAADEVGQHLSTPEDVVWAKDAAERIRDRSNTDALVARDARVRAEALRGAAEEANEIAQARLSDERDTALACRDRILALIPADKEGDG